MLSAGAIASGLGLCFGFLFRRKPVNDRAIGSGAEMYLLPMVCLPSVAISVAVYIFCAILDGPEAALRHCTAACSILAVLSAAIGAFGFQA